MAFSTYKSNPTNQSRDVYENSRQDFLGQDPNVGHRMSKGDIKPEVHFIGQITGGLDFGTNDGLFCEMILDIGNNWDIISPPRLYQTQTSYVNAGQMHVWNHPIDLHLAANDLNGCIVSYGFCHLPKKSGYSRLVCETWTPTGSSIGKSQYDALSFYMGNKPRLQSIDVLSKDLQYRELLNTQSSGKIVLEIECLMKNFDLLDISGQF